VSPVPDALVLRKLTANGIDAGTSGLAARKSVH
jgi:hypothetical protein